MSYVLFGLTSVASGTRDTWQTTASGADEIGFLAKWDEGVYADASTSSQAEYDLSAGSNTAFANDFADTSHKVLGTNTNYGINVNGSGPLVSGGLSGNTLTLALDDKAWNQIKNLELSLDDQSLGSVGTISLTNFVDVRVKLGSDDAGIAADAPVTLNIDGAKRGEIDASQANHDVIVDLGVWSNNSGWSNEFYITLGAGDDQLLPHGSSNTFKPVGGQKVDYDGSWTKIAADLGAGDDVFRSAAGFKSVDFVIAGTGDDVIDTGAGNDTMSGDAGNDMFVIGTGTGKDVITDYSLIKTTLGFDDIGLSEGGETIMPEGYAGFKWQETGVYYPDGQIPGYQVSSSPNLAFIAEANNGEIGGYEAWPAGSPVRADSLGEDFHFLSAQFSAAVRDGLTITARAYDDGILVGSKAFMINKGGPTLVTFSDPSDGQRFESIDAIEFASNDNNTDTNDYFGFDDFTFARGDVIDLQGVGVATTSFNGADTILTLTDGGSVCLQDYQGDILFA